MKKYNRFDEIVRFEKIRRRRKTDASYREEEYKKIAEPQIPGSIHSIEDRKVRFDGKRTTFKEGARPGVIIEQPESTTHWQALWVPFSTRTKNRNSDEVVFLSHPEDKVAEDCVALPFFSQSLHCKSFGRRSAILPYEKLQQIITIRKGMY